MSRYIICTSVRLSRDFQSGNYKQASVHGELTQDIYSRAMSKIYHRSSQRSKDELVGVIVIAENFGKALVYGQRKVAERSLELVRKAKT